MRPLGGDRRTSCLHAWQGVQHHCPCAQVHGVDAAAAELAIAVIVRELTILNFKLKTSNPAEGVYIGLTPRSSPAQWEPELCKLGSLDRGLEIAAISIFFSIDILQALVGVYLRFGLLWRPSLSAPAILFSFVSDHRGKTVSCQTSSCPKSN